MQNNIVITIDYQKIIFFSDSRCFSLAQFSKKRYL